MICTIWMVSIGFLVAANCGLLGTFLMLRRKAMVGDALSHAVLLGVVLGFLLTGRSHFVVFVVGALVSAAVALALMGWMERVLKVNHEVAIGMVFTSFFGLGVILIQLYTEKVDLDQGCVLYGQLITSFFDRWEVSKGIWIPRAVVTLGGILALNGGALWVGYRPLLLLTFDPDMAVCMGIRKRFWEGLVMMLTSLTSVVALKIVGAPLVVTFLILPPMTAYLMTNHLPKLLGYTLLLDFWIALLGYGLAVWLEASVPGAMAFVAGLFFGVAFVCRRYKIF